MIPLATTSITLLRTPAGDEYDEPYAGGTPAARTTVVAGVRAVIDRPAGREQVAGGEQSHIDLWLTCDPCPLDYKDMIRDDATGRVYRVVWTLDYGGHVEAGLQIIQGEV